MARQPVQQDNFINACANQIVSPLIEKQSFQNLGRFGITKELTIGQKVIQTKQREKDKLAESVSIYQPLFRQLKDEFPPNSYGHGYRYFNREAD